MYFLHSLSVLVTKRDRQNGLPLRKTYVIGTSFYLEKRRNATETKFHGFYELLHLKLETFNIQNTSLVVPSTYGFVDKNVPHQFQLSHQLFSLLFYYFNLNKNKLNLETATYANQVGLYPITTPFNLYFPVNMSVPMSTFGRWQNNLF